MGPTDRYDHGVLGDGIEASAIELRDRAGLVARIAVGTDEVVEGTSAMSVELVANDLGPELLVTVSDADGGARDVGGGGPAPLSPSAGAGRQHDDNFRVYVPEHDRRGART